MDLRPVDKRWQRTRIQIASWQKRETCLGLRPVRFEFNDQRMRTQADTWLMTFDCVRKQQSGPEEKISSRAWRPTTKARVPEPKKEESWKPAGHAETFGGRGEGGRTCAKNVTRTYV